jgi:hypothetical protein
MECWTGAMSSVLCTVGVGNSGESEAAAPPRGDDLCFDLKWNPPESESSNDSPPAAAN